MASGDAVRVALQACAFARHGVAVSAWRAEPQKTKEKTKMNQPQRAVRRQECSSLVLAVAKAVYNVRPSAIGESRLWELVCTADGSTAATLDDI